MYNVRVKKFLDTEQIQIYSTIVKSNKEDRRVDKSTGEILKREPGTMQFNPFTDEMEKMVEMKETDEERSKAVSRTRTIHKIYDVARSNQWKWFVTLTFNPDKVNSYDYSECTKKLSQWLKNCRKQCQDMKYIVVPELHKSGRWHFHGLFANCSDLGFIDSGHYSKGRKIYNIGSYNFGWTTAVLIDDLHKTCSYLCKYVTKELCDVTKGRKRYWSSRNVDLPEIIDMVIENPKDFRRYMVEKSEYHKKVSSEYLDVTYIEVQKGETERTLL